MLEQKGALLTQRPLCLVFAICGCIGFAFGLSTSTWQVTVETGQVLSGIVQYPKDNAFYMYHIKVFTIMNQFSALLLRIGFSERFACIFISGFLGLLSFEAIGTVIFAVSGNVVLSILGVILIYLTDFTGHGVVYPIWLMGLPHTYGILGTSFAVLCIGLLGCRAYHGGLFCIALAPCVHPSIGFWIALIVAVCALLDWRFVSSVFKKYYPYFLVGLFITALSAAYQIHLMQDLPQIDPQIKEQYFNAYIKYWDSHRTPLYWQGDASDGHFPWGVVYCLYSIITGLIGQKLFKENKATVLVFRIVAISGILSLLLGFLTQLPPDKIPSILLIFMPGRFINVNNLALVALLYGILTTDSHRSYTANLRIFAVLVLTSLFTRYDEAIAVVLVIILLWIGYLTFGNQAFMLLNRKHRIRNGYVYLTLIGIVLCLAINLPREKYVNRFIRSPERFNDWTNNEFYSTISNRDGLLLITHYSAQIQVRTRRRILVDMASPNFFSYTPESAIVFDRILRRIYGVDLLTPLPEHLQHQEVFSELYKPVWEERAQTDWQEIRREFDVTDVLTPLDWKLNLPVVDRNETTILYSIPAPSQDLLSYHVNLKDI